MATIIPLNNLLHDAKVAPVRDAQIQRRGNGDIGRAEQILDIQQIQQRLGQGRALDDEDPPVLE
jgi:hypothetical protein